MQEAQNTRVVQDAYAAFLRGDIPTVLDAVAEDVIWKPVTGAGPHVPFAGERRGKAAVAEFFRIVGETETFEQFEPREFIAQGDRVVALGHYRSNVHATRKAFEADWVMVFRMRGGKLAEFQEFTDSAAVNAAFEPAGV